MGFINFLKSLRRSSKSKSQIELKPPRVKSWKKQEPLSLSLSSTTVPIYTLYGDDPTLHQKHLDENPQTQGQTSPVCRYEQTTPSHPVLRRSKTDSHITNSHLHQIHTTEQKHLRRGKEFLNDVFLRNSQKINLKIYSLLWHDEKARSRCAAVL